MSCTVIQQLAIGRRMHMKVCVFPLTDIYEVYSWQVKKMNFAMLPFQKTKHLTIDLLSLGIYTPVREGGALMNCLHYFRIFCQPNSLI